MADLAAQRASAPRTPLAELRAATSFLTRVPVRAGADGVATTGAGAFGVVGAAVGLATAVPVAVLGPAHATIGGILAIAVAAILTGGLHLDGLADTVDALAAPAGAAERARTDPRAGSAGVVAIVVVLGIEVAALVDLVGRSGPVLTAATLVVAGAASRALAPVLAATVGRRTARPSGLGSWFAERVSRREAVVAAGSAALVLAAATVLDASPAWAGSIVAGIAAALVAVGSVTRARGQLDGDGYGFAIEAAFALVLVAAAVAG